MTETDNCDENRKDPQESSTDVASGDSKDEAAPPSDSPGKPSAEASRSRSGRSGFLVWLTLLIALTALGLASRPYWTPWLIPGSAETSDSAANELEDLADRVARIRQASAEEAEALRAELGRLSTEVSAASRGPSTTDLADRIEQLSSEISAGTPGPSPTDLADRIEQLSLRLERLQGDGNTAMGGVRSRLQDLETEVGRRLEQFELRLSNVGSNLDQADDELARRLLLTEVDSLLAIAQNQLAISGNGEAATSAWKRAMERLTALDGAGFQSLKSAARREFKELQEFDPPEIALQVEALYGTADEVAQWPVKTLQPGAQQTTSEAGAGWRDRLGRLFDNLVRVESVDREFIGPGAADMARDRVRSALQTAALAIVRGRPELARRLIDEASDAARSVFDAEAPIVAGALTRLEEIARNTGRADVPELTETRAEISRLLGEMR